jgi:hypothetical protein
MIFADTTLTLACQGTTTVTTMEDASQNRSRWITSGWRNEPKNEQQQAAGHNQNSPFCLQRRPGICLRLYRYQHGDPDNVIAFTMVRCCASCDKS